MQDLGPLTVQGVEAPAVQGPTVNHQAVGLEAPHLNRIVNKLQGQSRRMAKLEQVSERATRAERERSARTIETCA